MLRLLTAASCLVAVSMAVPWGARMTNPVNQMMSSPFRGGGMMGAMASFLMPDGTALQFAGKNLEQICYEAYVKTRGTDGLSDAMRTATQFMVSSPGAVGAGANRQWQCLFNFATGNGRSAAGAPNVIGDYFDTAMETPGIINPCHNPYCGEGNMTPFEMLRRMMVPGGMMPGTGSMLGGFGTMPKPVGGNPLNAVGASGAAGGAPAVPSMDAIFQAFGGANQAASQPAPTNSFINALASAAQLPLNPSNNTPAGGNASAPAVPAADAAAAGSSGAAKSPFTPQSLAQLAQIMAKMQTANQPSSSNSSRTLCP
ncbi:hypothetical protein C0Q70_03384 [Pomacea canaliculata]|uniref:Uncharacterized protein n=1 Tax=Pomacea canaliculata TaxID=400727 RepID=A0A2T7PSJ6_POMCA|nr:uncharacterized protein LOC112558184 [Pomacea canaliculata]XP_025084259.1 uncharacterized protein LOC112558184 [Pomacea canaliculata]XP_025084260.1 uncharacterized protein LOC112558184 [Pomacea canaliculata]PVD36401.1 hypothetical protein C0Q70_03384 [Pomacea canaliculata]